MLDPISTDDTTVYQYPQQLMQTEDSAALVIILLKNDAAIAIVQGWGPRSKTKPQGLDRSKDLRVSASNNSRDKQLVIEWLHRAEDIKEYLSAILK